MSTLKSKEEEPEHDYSTVVAYIRFQVKSVLAPSDSSPFTSILPSFYPVVLENMIVFSFDYASHDPF